MNSIPTFNQQINCQNLFLEKWHNNISEKHKHDIIDSFVKTAGIDFIVAKFVFNVMENLMVKTNKQSLHDTKSVIIDTPKPKKPEMKFALEYLTK